MCLSSSLLFAFSLLFFHFVHAFCSALRSKLEQKEKREKSLKASKVCSFVASNCMYLHLHTDLLLFTRLAYFSCLTTKIIFSVKELSLTAEAVETSSARLCHFA